MCVMSAPHDNKWTQTHASVRGINVNEHEQVGHGHGELRGSLRFESAGMRCGMDDGGEKRMDRGLEVWLRCGGTQGSSLQRRWLVGNGLGQRASSWGASPRFYRC